MSAPSLRTALSQPSCALESSHVSEHLTRVGGHLAPVIIELLGCMSDGATYEDAVANAQIVIAEWIETAETLGRPIPEPKGKLSYA